MTAPMRPCPSCGRHVRTDETRCAFCSEKLRLTHGLPPLSWGEARPAPKYGGPPMLRPINLIAFLLIATGIATLAWLLVR